ncbi:MAG: hypothetical protein M3451_07550 [Chloroflexota bacterium]|nr:hypothetical protein [Chloroflexota bacterium]
MRLCIDPFLLYKSRRENLQRAHGQLVGMFNETFARFQDGDDEYARELLRFPEASSPDPDGEAL